MSGTEQNERRSVHTTQGDLYDASLTPSAGAVRPGLEVFAADDERLGTVADVREHDFRLARTMQRDVYVPLDAVLPLAEAGRVVLNTLANQIDRLGWEVVPLT